MDEQTALLHHRIPGNESTRMRINKTLLPIKAHFFFFMAAMGPILPQLPVYGKQMGISTVVMGSVTGVLPLLFLVAKPIFGFIVDYFTNYRKTIFMGLLTVLGTSYALLYFLPDPLKHDITEGTYNFSQLSNDISTCNATVMSKENQCTMFRGVTCIWDCGETNQNITTYNITGSIHLSFEEYDLCYNPDGRKVLCSDDNCGCNFTCSPDAIKEIDCLYGTLTFWGFMLLLTIGTISYNVANSISDAICFDVLGENGQMSYGNQRVWGTIGFGISALISGYVVDQISVGETKTYTPVFIIVLIFIAIDLLSCTKLTLPPMPKSENIIKDVGKLLQHAHIVIFLIFATLAGIVDSFVVYFLFWYLEDLAIATNHIGNIKFLEGLTVAAETLGGEVIFFSISGRILEKVGFGHALTMCFVAYGLRLGLISLIPSPWWILPIELIMQGPTYALCYTTIVAYASAVSPPGTSATMQGIVAGMDDGFGYAIGSFLGGILYKYVGGQFALRVFSLIAFSCAVVHLILYQILLRKTIPNAGGSSAVEYKNPGDALATIEDGSMKK